MTDDEQYTDVRYGPWPLVALLTFWCGMAVLLSAVIIELTTAPRWPMYTSFVLMAVGLSLSNYMHTAPS